MNPVSPSLVAQWHPTKNGVLMPSDFTAGSGKKVWWQDQLGHEWEASLLNRSKGQGCPVCAGRKVLIGFNDISTTHPSAAEEWNPKNILKPTELTAGSSKRVLWLCADRHEWMNSVNNRTLAKQSCPFCMGKKAISGKNDLGTLHPKIAVQWHPTKNGELKPSDAMPGSSRAVWWQDEFGHEWKTSPSSRVSGTNCPYCAGLLAIEGETDLTTTHPQIAKEWHPTKNGDLLLQKIKAGSSTKVWWLCEQGHEWEAAPAVRRNHKCPYCQGRNAIKNVNDLQTLNPEIAAEWHPAKNGVSSPDSLKSSSNKKVWWLCQLGHEWESAVHKRLINQSCPFCSNSRVLVGFNDLSSTHPEIAAQWHPTKNGTSTPFEFTAGSDTKIWWNCKEGHEWEAWIYSRKANHGCPICWNAKITSVGENEIYNYITSTLSLDAEQNNRKILNGKELDIYIPDLKIAIEFNGLYWHSEAAGKNSKYHHDKWLKCKEQGIQLIQIWEDDWRDRKEIIKSALAHKLSKSTTERIFARKTKIFDLSTKEAQQFMKANHVQGFASGSHYIGLKHKNKVVAVMILKKVTNNTLNIIRYATSSAVVGGFTKLLSHAERTFTPDKFITFADHTVSDGGLYENNGFVADKELAPDYMYVIKNKRKHKFGYRLKKFRTDPGLIWAEGATERELAQLNGLIHIWDAGKTRYVKIIKLLST